MRQELILRPHIIFGLTSACSTISKSYSCMHRNMQRNPSPNHALLTLKCQILSLYFTGFQIDFKHTKLIETLIPSGEMNTFSCSQQLKGENASSHRRSIHREKKRQLFGNKRDWGGPLNNRYLRWKTLWGTCLVFIPSTCYQMEMHLRGGIQMQELTAYTENKIYSKWVIWNTQEILVQQATNFE